MAQPAQPGIPVVQKVPIITLRLQGPIPYPHPPCLDPTPDEEYQQIEANRQAQQQQKDVAQKAKGSGGSAFGKIASLASNVAHVVEKAASDVHSSAEAKLRESVQKKNEERFQYNYPELVAQGDRLICDYTCKVMHQGTQVTGDLQITNRHLCFSSDTLKEVIPFTEVASVQRSLALATMDNGPPFIMPVPAPNVLPDCLQVFSTKYQIFQFLKFESKAVAAGQVLTNTVRGRPIDRAYNFLDHAWRAATQVPLPQAQYAHQ
jgi:hypothetical protein